MFDARAALAISEEARRLMTADPVAIDKCRRGIRYPGAEYGAPATGAIP